MMLGRNTDLKRVGILAQLGDGRLLLYPFHLSFIKYILDTVEVSYSPTAVLYEHLNITTRMRV